MIIIIILIIIDIIILCQKAANINTQNKTNMHILQTTRQTTKYQH